MKLVAKIFIIIGMVFQCLFIIPVIVGVIDLVKLKNAKCKADVPVLLGILTIFFVNTIGGILMLLLSDADFAVPAAPEAPVIEAMAEEVKNDTTIL